MRYQCYHDGSIDTRAQLPEVASIGIGVFDSHQHIKNQFTVLVTIIDDGTIKTEIKRSRACPPAYVLIVDSIDTDHLNVDLDWFLDQTSDR